MMDTRLIAHRSREQRDMDSSPRKPDRELVTTIDQLVMGGIE